MIEATFQKTVVSMLKQKQENLFQEWKETRKDESFVKDGIFCPETWLEQERKILFVLKEANWEWANADLCRWLLDGGSSTCWKTWNNIARWAQALIGMEEYPEHISKEERIFWLGKIAFLNLKKTGGKAVADSEMIRRYAVRDAELIRKQILLCSPDLIVCCGKGKGKNADLLYDVVLKEDKKNERRTTVHGYLYFTVFLETEIPVISFYHPQMRGGHALFRQRWTEIKEIGGQFLP